MAWSSKRQLYQDNGAVSTGFTPIGWCRYRRLQRRRPRRRAAAHGSGWLAEWLAQPNGNFSGNNAATVDHPDWHVANVMTSMTTPMMTFCSDIRMAHWLVAPARQTAAASQATAPRQVGCIQHVGCRGRGDFNGDGQRLATARCQRLDPSNGTAEADGSCCQRAAPPRLHPPGQSWRSATMTERSRRCAAAPPGRRDHELVEPDGQTRCPPLLSLTSLTGPGRLSQTGGAGGGITSDGEADCPPCGSRWTYAATFAKRQLLSEVDWSRVVAYVRFRPQSGH